MNSSELQIECECSSGLDVHYCVRLVVGLVELRMGQKCSRGWLW